MLFLITGVSTGLGRAFASAALGDGHVVVGTLRDSAQLTAFEELAPRRAHARLLDVTDHATIPGLVDEVESRIGPIDVLVNNAGYGVEGVFEETPLAAFRDQFEVNVFGVVAMTQAVLPAMRRRRSGHLVFVTSMGGLRPFAGLSAYNGSKYAVEGIADALRLEVAALGIHVTSVEPGAFRTDWAGRSLTRVERSVEDYDELMEPIRAHRRAMSGQQAGDPAAAGRVLMELVAMPDPPGHLLMGSDAQRLVAASRAEVDAEFRRHRRVSASTDLADGLTSER